MASAACPKCGSHRFKLETIEPSDSRYKLNAVCCAAIGCGAVVGVLDYYNIGAVLDKHGKALKKIASVLKVVVDV